LFFAEKSNTANIPAINIVPKALQNFTNGICESIPEGKISNIPAMIIKHMRTEAGIFLIHKNFLLTFIFFLFLCGAGIAKFPNPA
jgi:hypothetical protein